MNWPGLPLRSSRPRRSVRPSSCPTSPASSARTGCEKRVDLLVRQVEREQADPAVDLFELKGLGHVSSVPRCAVWIVAGTPDSIGIRVGIACGIEARRCTALDRLAGRPDAFGLRPRGLVGVGHQDVLGLDPGDGLEGPLRDLLAERRDRAEVGVARPLPVSLRVRSWQRTSAASRTTSSTARRPSKLVVSITTRSCRRCESSAMRHWRSASLSWYLLIVAADLAAARLQAVAGELGVLGAGRRAARRQLGPRPRASVWLDPPLGVRHDALRSAQACAGFSGFGLLDARRPAGPCRSARSTSCRAASPAT